MCLVPGYGIELSGREHQSSWVTTMSVSHPVRLLREELQLLQEQGSYVGEVVRAMDKKKVLVKVKAASPQGPSAESPYLCV